MAAPLSTPIATEPSWIALTLSITRKVVTGSCSSSTFGIFQCTKETVGIEIRIYPGAELKFQLAELNADYNGAGALQGTSVIFTGTSSSITGQVGCGGDVVQIVSVSAVYACGY